MARAMHVVCRMAAPQPHRWIILVPLIVFVGWLIEQMIVGR
jgi:hypothetical protein